MTRATILAAALLLASTSLAQVPQKVGYQGRLLKADGSPEGGSHKLTFSIFDAASAGSSLWTEDQTLALSDGYYAAVLGDVTPLDLTAFNGSERFLQIAVDGTALSPRQRIDAVPYALVATNLKGGTVEATSIDASSFKVGGNTVIDSSGKLTGSAAYSAAAGSGLSVTGNTIALSSQGCANGQVLTWTNNAWACANPGQTYAAGSGILLNNGSFSVDPAGNSFVQNQTAAAQNASFRVGGTGSVGGDLGVGLAGPTAKMQVVGTPAVTGTGTVGCIAATDVALAGAGTKFTTEAHPGDLIVANGQTRTVVAITDDANLTVERAWGVTFTGKSFTVQRPVARFTTAANGEGLMVDGLGDVFAGRSIHFGNSLIAANQGGSIELGADNFLLNTTNATPFIDFHFGTAVGQDYNARLINDADGRLSAIANLRVTGTTTAEGTINTYAGIWGTNSGGNLHLDSDKTKGDGRIYLNYVDGKGVAFGNGARGVVGAVDTAGNATFNGSVSAGAGTVTAYNTGGEGGTIKLTGANGKNVHLESLNGLFRIVDSGWTAALFTVDQAGNVGASTYNGIRIWEKPGNNGTVSCDTFCEGAGWGGGTGTCISAKKNSGAGIACGTVEGGTVGVRCFCSSF